MSHRREELISNNEVKFKKLHPEVQMPEYATAGSNGFDLRAFFGPIEGVAFSLTGPDHVLEIQPGKLALIPTGLAWEPFESIDVQGQLSQTVNWPNGAVGHVMETIRLMPELQIRSRSGLAYKNSVLVLNAPATIDNDYRGHIQILLFNAGDQVFSVKHGDRIAQGVICLTARPTMNVVDTLADTARGSGGFGSTGV